MSIKVLHMARRKIPEFSQILLGWIIYIYIYIYICQIVLLCQTRLERVVGFYFEFKIYPSKIAIYLR